MDLKEIEGIGDGIHHHWYYRAKSDALLRMLEPYSYSTILDVGAGSSFFSKLLLERTNATCSWCVDTGYDADSDLSHAGKTIYYRKGIDDVQADLVLLMDVLEHVEHDLEMLQSYIDKVPSGAKFLISVPAFQFLWSQHDVFVEHFRRYTLEDTESLVKRSGLQLRNGFYYYGAVFPIAAALRLYERFFKEPPEKPQSQLKMHSKVVNSVLYGASSAELPLMKANRLFGLTVFCLAEKR